MLEKAVKNIGVIANCAKASAPGVLELLAANAGKLGLSLVADKQTAGLLPGARVLEADRLAGSVDVLMVLGGDGSMLKAVRLLKGAQVPVIGVNLGSLGFLTSVAEKDLEKALVSLASGEYTVAFRAMADCRISRDGVDVARYSALNEVLIHRGASTRIVTIDMKIGDETGTLCSCDGIVISTPTGSTGHSLSAGGPILHPGGGVFCVSLICPHTLSARPIVVPDTMLISATVIESSGNLVLTVDGQVGNELVPGDVVHVTRAGETVGFVCLRDYSYFSVLRQKLHWRGAVLGQ